MPIAAVFHKLAAVAVPFTVLSPLKIAPPPMKPMPVIIAYMILASGSAAPP